MGWHPEGATANLKHFSGTTYRGVAVSPTTGPEWPGTGVSSRGNWFRRASVKILALVVLGGIGALGVLRGLEIKLVTHATARAIFPLAVGLLFMALSIREWRKRAVSSASR